MRFSVFLSSCLLSSCLYLTNLTGAETLTYQSATAGVETLAKWTIETTSSLIEINGHTRGCDVLLEYSPTFSLLRFLEKDSSEDAMDIHREGENVIVKKKNKIKTLKLKNEHWIQEFKFGFQPFLKGKATEYPFGIVYSKDLSIHDMVATKEKVEEIEVDGQKYTTQKLKITLRGFKRKFWKAEAWFDLKTHLMVKYSSNEGPGTDHVEVTLVQK